MKSIKINTADNDKTLYEIFAAAVHQEVFFYENAQSTYSRVTTHLCEITQYLFRLISKPANASMSAAPSAIAKENAPQPEKTPNSQNSSHYS